MLFKGRLSFKQYISSKRARFGIKLYQLSTSNDILLDFLVYHGKLKVVYVLSTEHAPAVGHTTKRDKDGNVIQKPTSINAYNHSMGGVDMMDQQLAAIDVLRKS